MSIRNNKQQCPPPVVGGWFVAFTKKMKYLLIITLLISGNVCFGQQVELATSIAPEDLGAYKWRLSGTAQENEVVIFRVTTVRDWNGKVTTEINDTVCYAPGKKETGTAFFIDPDYFNTTRLGEPKWVWSVFGGSGWIEGKYAGHSYSEKKATISFKSKKWGKTQKILEVFVKPYEDAKLLYVKLPPISLSRSWSWAGSPKKQSKQVAAPGS